MKIKSTDSVGSTSGVKKAGKARSTTGGTFASHLQETEEAQGVVSTRAVGGIEALLSLQSAGDEPSPEREAKEHGEQVLDALEGILHDLLSGNMPISRLHNLTELMARQRAAQGVSPKMLEIIDEIEMRALVELAKYESYL